MGETSFQFQCPSCSAVLQATLTKELTSVQCGECYDVFDVQHPGSVAAGAETANGEAAPGSGAEAPAGAEAAETNANDGPRKQQRGNAGVDVHSAGVPPQTGMVDDEATAQNLESSLQSCTAHRERIEQMLADEPNNKNLLDLREQLTNAITQLQGTKEMVARTQASRRPGMPGIGAAFAMGAPEKGPSCRKNKAQRCSVCGGIGHKSRTCSVVQQQQALQQQQQVQMQHQAGVQMHQAAGMPVQVPMYAAVPTCPPPVSAAPPLASLPASLPAPPPAPIAGVEAPPAEIAAPTAPPAEAKTEPLVDPQGAS
mmetsp:Transcript_5116/g.10004  ORF Transcript_5116/g.10004 Transcript_5116/m.10004 type:complete len:312 (-) Transcript_5116:216-1151(-)